MKGDTNFECLANLKANNKIPVVKYRSRRSGLTVTVAQVDGPVVNGYFCLATEAHDDDGLPHTLEHLVFMGSELYPYKGVLDLLARCLRGARPELQGLTRGCGRLPKVHNFKASPSSNKMYKAII